MKNATKNTSMLSILLIAALLFVSFMIIKQWRSAQQWYAEAALQDIKTLKDIFGRIHHDCVIVGFDQSKLPIDFLTVGSFVGGQVGGMSLMYPQKWQGPYLQANPSINGVEYVVVTTNKGSYVVPGDGITLPNGKKIGTDIVISATTDIDELANSSDGLRINNEPLAFKIAVATQGFGYISEDELENI